ncbi:glycoside hydrolase family 16 protein [Dactylosporangium sucinum]|uniref:Endo-1,3-beta-glucanase n=1 Tax=Dactylosporangium sucinum TaxID=1424081 RepID=A0A917X7J5_9ACTN|nr:glycoside hydrolase family 16 protein [Dactylosporangium sucinum]GGM85649.1 endo-1,3-beta-glucanase [Dactylosporangium sucinum]
MTPTPTRRRRRFLLATAAATVLTATTVVTVNAWASLPSTPSGWTLQWSDDFTGSANTLPSSSNWIYTTGTQYSGGPAQFGTGEIQTYTTNSQNLGLDGSGNLKITPIKASNGSWTSARIETKRTNFKPPSGGVLRIEGRLAMPNVTGGAAAGYWPAFWALGSPYRGNYWNWPGIGELDIMENVNGLNQVWGTLHCGVNPGGPCNETNGLGATRGCPNSNCQGNFHTYAIEWDAGVSPQMLRWYVDGVNYLNVSQNTVGSYWSNMTSHEGYFILLNVAMGGAFPNGVAGYSTPTSSTVSGKPMLVDYVAVYTKGGSGGTTNPTTGNPTPTSTGTGGSGTRNAYSTIEAESFNAQSGVVAGPGEIGYIANGDWVQYNNVDFGGASPRDVMLRLGSGAAGGISGLVEVKIDSLSNASIATTSIANTGGWSTWKDTPSNLNGSVTGKHTVYLKFTSGQPADFVNVDSFYFRK